MQIPRKALAAVVTLAWVSGMHAARAQDNWNFELIPFAWASGLDGQQAIGDVQVDIDAPFSDLLDFVNIGGWLRFSARHEPWSLYGEIAYVELGEEDLGPFANTSIGITQTLAEAGVGYWFNDNFSVYGGIRYQDLDTDIDVASLGTSHSESWVDGVVGAQWTPVASDNWLVWLRGDAGAGGSDLVWLMETGVGYSWNESYALYLAYRMLDTDYKTDEFLYDMQQSGLLIGFGFRF